MTSARSIGRRAWHGRSSVLPPLRRSARSAGRRAWRCRSLFLPPLRATSARSVGRRAWRDRLLLLPPLREPRGQLCCASAASASARCGLRCERERRGVALACCAREGPSVAKCPGWSLRDHCLGRYNLTGEAGRSSARHGRVRVGRACVVWFDARYVYSQLIPINSNRSAVAVT